MRKLLICFALCQSCAFGAVQMFDNGSAIALLNDDSSFTSASDNTWLWSCWFRLTDNSKTNYFCSRVGNTVSLLPQWELRLNNPGRTNSLELHILTSAGQSIWTTAPNAITNVGIWKHLACTFEFNAAGAAPAFWIDGEFYTGGGAWTTGAGLGTMSTVSSRRTFLGKSSAGNDGFSGFLDDFIIWRRIPATNQIVAIAKSKLKYAWLNAFNPVQAFSDKTYPVCSLNFETAIPFVSVTATNAFRDWTRFHHHGSPTNSPVAMATSVASYFPNE